MCVRYSVYRRDLNKRKTSLLKDGFCFVSTNTLLCIIKIEFLPHAQVFSHDHYFQWHFRKKICESLCLTIDFFDLVQFAILTKPSYRVDLKSYRWEKH